MGLPSGLRVLDIGTGTGALARLLVDRGHAVHGIDASGRVLERARTRVPGATFERCSIAELDRFGSGSYDLVTMGFVLHGLSPGLRRHALQHAARIGAGRVVVFDYGRDRSWMVDIVEAIEGPHYFEYVRSPFERMLQEAGLESEAWGREKGGAQWWLTRRMSG